jgi:hypothetical protein
MDEKLFELHKAVLTDPNLNFWKKRWLLNELRKTIPAEQNRWNFRWIVWTLAVVALSVPAWVAWSGKSHIPEGLLSLASTAVGALAAFLAPQRQRQADSGSPTSGGMTAQHDDETANENA